MSALFYVRLIGDTAGTLLQLFWLAVILAHRRRRNLERVLFFLCFSLFLYYSGSLLVVNAQIHYPLAPPALKTFATLMIGAALCLLPPLLVQIHVEYARIRGSLGSRSLRQAILAVAYAPLLYFGLAIYPRLVAAGRPDFLFPARSFGRGYGLWLAASMVFAAAWQWRFAAGTQRAERFFHSAFAALLAAGGVLALYLHLWGGPANQVLGAWLNTSFALLPILPLSVLAYQVHKFRFLQIGGQKNLLYAVSAMFLAILYLSLVRRVGLWMEPVLPPEATSAVLLFALLIFVEPLQRVFSGRLRATLHSEVDRLQRTSSEIQEVARQGSLSALTRFVEQRVKEVFGLASVRMELGPPVSPETGGDYGSFAQRSFALRRGADLIGTLYVEPYGALLSGETLAALDFLCEQLPGSLELCRLIEEKVQLERELAERERLALVGQMAASISHNLKNPLGSIKTILQVQLEGPDLPERLRGETRLVLEEVSRLSAKLNQLLQFSRPAVRADQSAAHCDVRAVGEEAAGILRHEAASRGIRLETEWPEAPLHVAASREALRDILANLLVNALEAVPASGWVHLRIAREAGSALLTLEDDGPGIPPEISSRITQPFFTTKAQGTGLGLAIVSRRVAECGGRLDWQSPVKDGRGTRFQVTLPLASEEARKEKGES
jgi:signal transduction histidine kinase